MGSFTSGPHIWTLGKRDRAVAWKKDTFILSCGIISEPVTYSRKSAPRAPSLALWSGTYGEPTSIFNNASFSAVMHAATAAAVSHSFVYITVSFSTVD